MKKTVTAGSLLVLALAAGIPASAQFQSALSESQATADEARRSQQRINELDSATSELLNQFRADQKQLDASRRYNRSLSQQLEAQERRIARLSEDIENVSGLQQAVEPLMEDMVAAFEQFVNNDLPFNLEGPAGRLARVDRMRETLGDPGKSAAEQYRTIIEGYKLENEFGRTVNYYTGGINLDGEEIKGEFLQVGRVELIFKTADDSLMKRWNNQSKTWEDLALSYVPDVKIAMRMAKGQMAPGLFALPMAKANAE